MKQNLSKLIESQLDEAEIVLAAKNMAEDIQNMVEDVAKMRVDDLLPLVDQMKEIFDQERAERYKTTVDQQLQQAQDLLSETKDTLYNEAMVLSGEAPPETDMGMGDMDMDSPMDVDGMDDLEMDDDDVFGGADAMDGGDEVLGRAKKESLLKKKRVLESKLRQLKKKKAKV